ncbi:MAG: S41 family peptidase, partial [Cyclobacteriaceae bacterium]|nr:S41 family peptidase [Cyclobacteriaceae bacterium]
PLPLYLSAPERSPYYEWIPKADNVLYFNFERYPEWDQMRSFGMGLIRFIQDNEVKKLIVDLRENGGGDFKKGLKLIEELQKTYLNAPGKVFVIIGRNTFSAGMSNAAHFKTMLHATLVGETTGARPVGYQENFSFTLPHSNIPASCAVKRYAFLDEDTDGIIPDKEILPDFDLYKTGRDAAIEWIVSEMQYTSENAIDYGRIYSLCMDANVKEALTLLTVEEHKMSAQDKKFKQQFEQRFRGEKDMTVYSVSKDSLIHQLISMFSNYWKVSLLDPMNNYDRQLGGNLIGFLKRNYPPVREKSIQLDSLGIYLSRFIHSRGFYTREEIKKTGRLYDLVIWSEQQDTTFSVNQFGEQKLVVVSMLDGFETLGWMDYATLGKHYSSGWATHDKLYCVRKAYNLGSEEFKVSFLAHEAQHLADSDRYPLLKNADLEYRAKLAELDQANETVYDLLEFFIRNSREDSGNGHSVANHRVIRDLSVSIFNTDFEENMDVWRGKDKLLINKQAGQLLQANSKLLEKL